MQNFEDYLNKGYTIEQINQIIKADEETKNYLLHLNPKVPDSIFRKIRQKNIHSLILMDKLNKMILDELDLVKNNDSFFDAFSLSEETYFGKTPFKIDLFKNANTVIVGTPGTGKSIYGKLLKSRNNT